MLYLNKTLKIKINIEAPISISFLWLVEILRKRIIPRKKERACILFPLNTILVPNIIIAGIKKNLLYFRSFVLPVTIFKFI